MSLWDVLTGTWVAVARELGAQAWMCTPRAPDKLGALLCGSQADSSHKVVSTAV